MLAGDADNLAADHMLSYGMLASLLTYKQRREKQLHMHDNSSRHGSGYHIE
jgi:hypothetical protein